MLTENCKDSVFKNCIYNQVFYKEKKPKEENILVLFMAYPSLFIISLKNITKF